MWRPFEKKYEDDQISQSHKSDQPTALHGRGNEHGHLPDGKKSNQISLPQRDDFLIRKYTYMPV